MKPRVLLIFCAIIGVVNGCSRTDKNSDSESIPYHNLQVMSYDDISEDLFGNMQYTVLKTDSAEYMFTSPQKIVYKDNTFYIHDWVNPRNSKVVAFDNKGNPVLSLNKRGRGPGEYLQISDFDIDENGDIWIMDGQDDVLLHYSNDCSLIDSKKLPFEVNSIKCINGGMLFFGLAPWNLSDYDGVRILLSDTALNIKKIVLNYYEFVDPNYVFSSVGFTELDGSLLYHQPISDTVYKFNNEGELIETYNFDFGSQSVPDKIRKDIGLNYEELEHFSFLAKSVYIDESIIIGSVRQGRYKDFVINRKQGKLYLKNEDYDCLHFMGVADGKIIYRILPGKQTMIDNLPEDILSNLESGNEVLAHVKIDSLFQ
jgi:hypothetical protein